MVNLVEIYENKLALEGKQRLGGEAKKFYSLRDISINPDHIISMREDVTLVSLLSESKSNFRGVVFPPELDARQKFTRICLQRGNFGWDLIVVGGLGQVREKLDRSQRKTLLNG